VEEISMKSLRKLALIIIVLLTAISLISVDSTLRVKACGGFFCQNVPIDQNAERIIFMVNDDQTITAVVGINYVGEAEDFSWVVPVPSPPELAVTESSVLDLLDTFTRIRIIPPTYQCGTVMPGFIGFGGGGDGPDVTIGEVGPYDYAVLKGEDATELVDWLNENHYRVTEDMIPIIQDYVDEGMYFLAMKLKRNAEVSDIQPVVMTYQDTEPMIPIKLTAVAAVEDMPVIVWILGNAQYVPSNYAHPAIDFASFRSAKTLFDTGTYGASGGWGLVDAYERIQNQHDGRAFVTEYAQPTSVLLEDLATIELSRFDWETAGEWLTPFLKEYPYITRLRAQLSPEQMTFDPIFEPDSTAQNFSNQISLNDYTDPIYYYHCATREEISSEEYSNLPTGLTRNGKLQLAVAHPEDWVLSEIKVSPLNQFYDGSESMGRNSNALPDEIPVWILAPEVVDKATLERFFEGEDTPPMFVFSEMFGWLDFRNFSNDPGNINEEKSALLSRLGQPDTTLLPGAENHQVAAIRYRSAGNEELDTYGGVILGMLATEKDWKANGAIYDAMMTYARSYQYYASAEWENTLFVPLYWEHYSPRVELAYPRDWYEYMNQDEEIILTPAPVSSNQEANHLPYLKLIPLDHFERFVYDFYDTNDLLYIWVWQQAHKWMFDYYQLHHFDAWVDNAVLPLGTDCSVVDSMLTLPFKTNGREGIVRYTASFIIEASYPIGYIDSDKAMLDQIYENTVQSLQSLDSEFDLLGCY
jgi:hypothetical protein